MNTPPFVPDNWYYSFFSAPINRFWEALVPDAITQPEIEFVERHLLLKPRSQILDVPCGAGRHSLELARRGHRVTGIDLSTDAIERARKASSEAQLPLTLLCQDMSCLQVAEQFDGAICMGNSFGYLTHTDLQSFLRAIHNCLRVGARFIVDSGMTAESILANVDREAKYEVADYIFEIRNDYDIARSRLLSHTVLRRGAEEWRQSFSHAVYTCGELGRMFADQGFAIKGMFADLVDTPYALAQGRLLLVASRR